MDHVILGEFGIWLGSGSDVGVSHTFTSQDRQNYYRAIISATREVGIVMFVNTNFFEQANIDMNEYALVNLTTKDFFFDDAADVLLAAYGSSIITLSASTTTPSLGTSVTLSGTVTPKASGAAVWLSIRSNNGSWSNLSSASVDSQSKYSYTWACNAYGAFEIKASWSGDGTAPAAESNAVSITVPAPQRTVTLTAYPSTIVSGNTVTFYGSISPPSSGVQVKLYSFTSGSWEILGQAQSDSSGSFTYTWHPLNVGSYQIKAAVAQDLTGGAAESSPDTVTVNGSIPENPPETTMISLLVSIALISALSLVLADLNRRPKAVPKNN